jgi:FlgD Ig-like domain
MKKLLVLTLILSICSTAQAIEVIGTTPGDGGDTNLTTFHFDENNVDFQLTRADGTAITEAEIPYLYSTSLAIFSNSQNYLSTNNLTAEGANLAGANWTNAAYPAQGKVAIDPATGRIKFSAPAWKTPVIIDDPSLDTSYNGRIDINNAGKAICSILQDAGTYNWVYANHYDPSTGWQGPIGVYDPAEGGCSYNRISMNETGDAWYGFAQSTGIPRGHANIYRAGFGWQGHEIIDHNASNNIQGLDIASMDSGKAIYVFDQNDTVPHIFANVYTLAGVWGGAVQLDAATNSPVSSIAVQASSNDTAICVFLEDDYDEDRVYSNRFNGSGWEGAVRIDNTTGTDSTDYPNVAINDSGYAIAAFLQNYSGGVCRVYTNIYIPGSGWQGAVQVDNNTGNVNDKMTPHVVIDNSNNMICVFNEDDGVATERAYAVYNPGGAGWQTPVPIDPNYGQTIEYDESDLAINKETGQAICVLTQHDGVTYYRLYATTYIPDLGWQTPIKICKDINDTPGMPDVAMNEKGNAFCSYSQSDGSKARIWVNQHVDEIPYRSVTVKYYYQPSPTPTATPEPVSNQITVTNRKVEVNKGESAQITIGVETAGIVSVKVYNLNGKLVATLADQHYEAGNHTVTWAAKNAAGAIVASGVYVVHVKTPDMTKTQKIVVIK